MASTPGASIPNVTLYYNVTDTGDHSADIATSIQVLLMVIFLVVLVFICGGNMLTILAVWRTPALRTVSNMYVVSLAVADFLTGMIIPYYAVSVVPHFQVYLDTDKYLCLFRYVLFHICVAQSIECMVVIAVDRFLYIRYPLHYNSLTSHRKAGCVIAATWILSTLIGMVPLFENGWKDGGKCTSYIVLTSKYRVYGLVPGFFVCCLLTAVCYVYIVRRAMTHQREANARRLSQLSGSSNAVIASRNEWKSVKVFLMVYGVFFACWCPNFTLLIVGYYVEIPYSLVFFTVVLGFLNSGMNFIIYAGQNRHFRNAFKGLLCRGRRRNSNLSNSQLPSMAAMAAETPKK